MPGVSIGVAPFLRLHRSLFSFAVEGRFERLAVDVDNGNLANVRLAGGMAVPCYHSTNVAFCWPVLVGRYDAEGVFPAAQSSSALFVATGIRLAVEIPLTAGVWGFFRAELLANMTRHELTLAGREFWQVPIGSFTLTAGALASIL
jgi:hypothetical protein